MAQDPALAEAVAAAVLAHPGVAPLSGGPFGTIASYLPGRRVVGCGCRSQDGDPVQGRVALWGPGRGWACR